MGISLCSWATSSCLDYETTTTLSDTATLKINFVKIKQGHIDDFHDDSLEFELNAMIKGYNLVSISSKNGKKVTSKANLSPEFGGVRPIKIAELSFSVKDSSKNERFSEVPLSKSTSLLIPMSELHYELSKTANRKYAYIQFDLKETNYIYEDKKFNPRILPIEWIERNARMLARGREFLLEFKTLGTSKVRAEIGVICN